MSEVGQIEKTQPEQMSSGLLQTADIARRGWRVANVPQDSDVPCQAPNARLIVPLLPFWLEGLGDGSCRGEGGT